jgi:hypothetical protein
MRSKFVSSLGWLTIVVSVLLGIFAGIELAAFVMVSNQPELAIQIGLALQQQTGQFVDMNSLPAQLSRQALTHGVTALLGIPVAIGLLKRREWARKLTIFLIVLVTLGMAPQLLFSELPPQIPRWLTAGVFLFAAAVHAGIIRKLMRPEIRSEFQA